jgi:hypothetical protein
MWSHNNGLASRNETLVWMILVLGVLLVRTVLKMATISAALVASAVPAHAATVMFNFGNTTGQSNAGAISSNNSALDANGRIFTAGSGADTVRVRASGWSIDGSTVRDSFLGIFSGSGLGVTSGDEVAGDLNRHTVDNQTRTDFILLQFDRNVKLNSAVFNSFKLYNLSTGAQLSYQDNDATIGRGFTNTAWNSQPGLNNQNVSALDTLIPVANRYASAGTGSSAVRAINTNDFIGNIWLISAAMANHNADQKFDSFKLNSLTVTTTAVVPEPASWAMMIAGFGLIGGAMRRRSAQSRPASA